jgi:drug/metabolite transporter (DMT)-like permease
MPPVPRTLTRLQADLILLFTAAVWGSGFIAQRVAAPNLSIFFYNGGRFLLGAILLFPLIRFRLSINSKDRLGVALAGILLFLAGAFQQAGMRTTSAGNAGFITGLYVVFVPIFLFIIWREKQNPNVWFAAILAVFGMFLLSSNGVFQISGGDFLEFIGAILWALHVIVVSRSIRNVHPLHFAVGQFLVCAALNLTAGFVIEPDAIRLIPTLWWTIIYNGVASVAIGFTLQGIGQKHAPPTDAALILSMESVFAAVLGYLFLQEQFSTIQLIGCFLVMAAIILAQIPQKQKKIFQH